MTATDQPAFGATVEDVLAPQAPDRPDGEQRQRHDAAVSVLLIAEPDEQSPLTRTRRH